MADAKRVFEGLGFTEVKTFLASGNIRFKVVKGAPTLDELTATLEVALKKKFGFETPVLIRSLESIQSLVKADPLKGITVTPETRLYVTFIEGKPLAELKLPCETPEKDFKILCKTKDGAVCSVLTLLRGRGSVDATSKWMFRIITFAMLSSGLCGHGLLHEERACQSSGPNGPGPDASRRANNAYSVVLSGGRAPC